MNQEQLMKKRNDVARLVRFPNISGSHRRCVRINTHNTFTHELEKFMVCWDLAKEGKEFITEAIFKNNKRADILILDDAKVIEILKTETLEKAKEKVKDYPEELEVEFRPVDGRNM